MTAQQLSEYTQSWTQLDPTQYFRQQGVELPDTPDPTHEHQKVYLKAPPGLTGTKLPGGKLSILVDLGSRINVIGSDTEKQFAAVVKANNHSTTYEARKTRLTINGVGSGGAVCKDQAMIPVAMKFEDRKPTLDVFKANIAEGSGANLPAILGSESMQSKNSVLMLKEGKEVIAFPGPGGYKIIWSKGTHLLPMVHAPSGHLVIQCDGYEDLVNGSQDEQMTFVTDHTIPEPPTPEEMSRGNSNLQEKVLIAKPNTESPVKKEVERINNRGKKRAKK
jgi:hypothetical protein